MEEFKVEDSKKTALGVEENIEAVLCYILGLLTGIIFLLLEKDNKFVRFHAMQSLATFGGIFLMSVFLGFIPVLGWIISLLLAPVSFVLWLFLMFKAFKGEKFKLPVIGDWAEQQVG